MSKHPPLISLACSDDHILRMRGSFSQQSWDVFRHMLAIAVQHEYDHLQGVLMIDRLGPLKKRLLHRKMLKREASATA